MGRNLFQVASILRNYGVGDKFARRTWLAGQEVPMHWTLTRVELNSTKTHGKAWGVFTSQEGTNDHEQPIRGSLKPDWRVLNEALEPVHRLK